MVLDQTQFQIPLAIVPRTDEEDTSMENDIRDAYDSLDCRNRITVDILILRTAEQQDDCRGALEEISQLTLELKRKSQEDLEERDKGGER